MKYERLTERDEFGNADVINVNMPDVYNSLTFDEVNTLTRALNRLAELEDKIESGELITEIAVIKKQHKSTTLELPCKVGDTLYEPFIDHVREWEVLSFYVFCLGIRVTCMCKDTCVPRHEDFRFGKTKKQNDFGNRVFVTRKAAEKKLKEKELKNRRGRPKK